MKFYYVAFLLLSVAFVHAEDKEDNSSEEINKEDVQALSELMKDKFNVTFIDDMLKLFEKVEKKCPDLEQKVDDALDAVAECIENVELGSDTFCQLLRKNYGKCSKPVRELITGCLPEESKGLPLIGEKIMGSLLDQFCNSTVEQVLELFNPCALEKDPDEVKECEGLADTFKEHKNELPSKKLICDLLPKLKGCAKAAVETSCKNPVTKEAHLQYYEAIDDATHDDCAELNKA